MPVGSITVDNPIEINRRNWDERAAIHAREALDDGLARFQAGEDALHAIEAAEFGDISGKRVLHLQCHIGRDTLCLARRGAVVTGLDFSPAAIDVARRLSMETGLKAAFIRGTVDETPRLAPGPFDPGAPSAGYPIWATGRGPLHPCWPPGANFIALTRILASLCWRSRPGGSCRRLISKPLPIGPWNSWTPSRRPIWAIPLR